MYNSTGRIKSYVKNAHVAVNSTTISVLISQTTTDRQKRKKKMLTIGARLLEVRRRFYVVSLVSLLRHEKIQN